MFHKNVLLSVKLDNWCLNPVLVQFYPLIGGTCSVVQLDIIVISPWRAISSISLHAPFVTSELQKSTSRKNLHICSPLPLTTHAHMHSKNVAYTTLNITFYIHVGSHVCEWLCLMLCLDCCMYSTIVAYIEEEGEIKKKKKKPNLCLLWTQSFLCVHGSNKFSI